MMRSRPASRAALPSSSSAVIQRRRRIPRRVTLGATAVLAATLLLAVSACSSSSSASAGGGGSTSSGSAAGSGAAGVTSARATVAKFEAAQPAITIPALPSKPPAGLTIVVIGCPLPACQATTSAAISAAHVLGWKVTSLTSQVSPQSYISSFNQALTDNPKLLAYVGFLPNSTVQSQLTTAKARGIKVVGMAPSNGPSPLMPGAYASSTEFVQAGKLAANIVVADAGKPVGTLYVRDPVADGIFGPELAAYTSTLKQLCSGCTNTNLEISSANAGRTVPGQIVSALQRNPSIHYVVTDLDDYLPGVGAALQSAGLAGSVKIIGQTPDSQSLAAIRSGQELASVGDENGTSGWRAVDGLARLYMGIPLGTCCTAPAGWEQIFTQANAPAASDLSPQGTPKVPGDPGAFLTAWHVS